MKLYLFSFLPLAVLTSLTLPFHRTYFPSINNKTPFTSFFNNFISVELCLGTPVQCLSLNLELNVYPLWVISSASTNKTEAQKSFNNLQSDSYDLKNTFLEKFNYDKYVTAYLSYDHITFDKTKQIKDIFFLLVEEFSEVPVNSGVLGLDFQNRIYQDTPGSNLVYQLKQKDIISSYAFSILYDDSTSNDYLSYEKGKLIVGMYPHDIIPSLKQKKLIYEKVVQVGTTIKWGYLFKKLIIDNKVIEEDIKGGFSIELGVNIGTVAYHEYVYKALFEPNKKFCTRHNFMKLFFSYICDSKIDLNSFPSLTFTFSKNNYKFTFTKDDLFMNLSSDKLMFLVVFPGKDYIRVSTDWTFGAPLFKKYPLVFDMDKKVVGFYEDDTNIALPNNINTILLWMIFIALLILIAIGGLYYYRKRSLIRRNKKNYFNIDYENNNDKK